MRRYQIETVPHVIINGKYETDVGMAGGHEQLLALINDLAAAEKSRCLGEPACDRRPTRCCPSTVSRRPDSSASSADHDAPLPEEAIWLDLLEPTVEEERLVEARLGLDIPTREEMREIESSSRLYEEEGALYLTATVVTKLDTALPENAQVTFILKGSRLVTNRYVDPLPFRRFVALYRKASAGQHQCTGRAGRAASNPSSTASPM